MANLNRIIITGGEPAGIGPDIILQAATKPFAAELVVLADQEMLAQRAAQLKLKIQFIAADLNKIPQLHRPGFLPVIHFPLAQKVMPGQLNQANASYVIEMIKFAASECQKINNSALVTAPIHKAILHQAGHDVMGHTEFLAKLAKVDQVVMLLVAEKLRIALLTMHIPLAKVPAAITQEKIKQVMSVLQYDLQTKFKIKNPRIFVAGLNPHAGESGELGREEIETIIPALNELRSQGYNITGPLSADTLFIPENLAQADVFLMMYHDQGLPVIKHVAFDSAVNVTLGLPYVRTSPDHGTALSLAGAGLAKADSLIAAINLAISLIK